MKIKFTKKQLEILDKIAQKSKLTQKDADELSKRIKKATAKRFRLFKT